MYSEPCQTTINYFCQALILDVWQGSKYVSSHNNNLSFHKAVESVNLFDLYCKPTLECF